MAAAVTLTLGFVAIEAAMGWFAHSLALLSDAGHNLADAAALGLSWYALSIANKPSHAGMTFGYHRVGVFAALVNAITLVAIAALIAWEAIGRIRHPQPAEGGLMIAVAAAAIVINLAVGLWLHKGAKDDLNIRSAYIHMMGDALSAFGVVIAGVLVLTIGFSLADPIVSLLIALLILYSSYGVLRDSATVLLEGTPVGINMPAVIAAIKSVDWCTRRPRPARVDGRPGGRRVQLPYPRRRAKHPRGAAGIARGRARHQPPLQNHPHDRAGGSRRLRRERHVLHGPAVERGQVIRR